MYCIYCGKKCPDIAKFCPNCGKEQYKPEADLNQSEENQHTIDEETGNTFNHNSSSQLSVTNTPPLYNVKVKPVACAAGIISLTVEAIIILLTFTDIFKINIGNSYYYLTIEIGIFDLFDAGSNIPRVVRDTEEAAPGFVWYAVLCLVCIAVCAVYYLYNLFSYSFSDERRCIWGKDYARYSSVPAIIFIVISLIGIIIFSFMEYEYIEVVPNSSLIGIYILTGIQFVTNIIYDSGC